MKSDATYLKEMAKFDAFANTSNTTYKEANTFMNDILDKKYYASPMAIKAAKDVIETPLNLIGKDAKEWYDVMSKKIGTFNKVMGLEQASKHITEKINASEIVDIGDYLSTYSTNSNKVFEKFDKIGLAAFEGEDKEELLIQIGDSYQSYYKGYDKNEAPTFKEYVDYIYASSKNVIKTEMDKVGVSAAVNWDREKYERERTQGTWTTTNLPVFGEAYKMGVGNVKEAVLGNIKGMGLDLKTNKIKEYDIPNAQVLEIVTKGGNVGYRVANVEEVREKINNGDIVISYKITGDSYIVGGDAVGATKRNLILNASKIDMTPEIENVKGNIKFDKAGVTYTAPTNIKRGTTSTPSGNSGTAKKTYTIAQEDAIKKAMAKNPAYTREEIIQALGL
jgi:hypothetical protein